MRVQRCERSGTRETDRRRRRHLDEYARKAATIAQALSYEGESNDDPLERTMK